MKFQSQKSSCGPAALSAALQAVGILRTEDELTHLAGTTTDGTEWEGMLKALRTVQKSAPQVVAKPFEDNAEVGILRLLRALDDGYAVVCIAMTEKPWDHYLTVVGRLGRRLCIFDPGSSDAFSTAEVGEFMGRWRGPKGARKPYAGIIV